MKKTLEIITIVIILSTIMATGVFADNVSSAGQMAYDSGSGTYLGTFHTTETPAYIEIYTTSGYLEKGGIINIVAGEQGVYTLTEYGLEGGDPTGQVKMEYGATLPMTQYPMDCHIVYAALPENAVSVRWGISFSGAGTLIDECMVVKAKVPEETKNGTIATGEPETLLLYFISTEGAHIAPSQVTGIMTSYMAKDKDGNITDYRPSEADIKQLNVKKILLFLLFIAVICLAAYYVMNKRKEKKEKEERKEKRLAEKNGRIEAIKEREGEQIKEYMETQIYSYTSGGFDDGFDDDEEESGQGSAPPESSPSATETKPTAEEPLDNKESKEETGRETNDDGTAGIMPEYAGEDDDGVPGYIDGDEAGYMQENEDDYGDGIPDIAVSIDEGIEGIISGTGHNEDDYGYSSEDISVEVNTADLTPRAEDKEKEKVEDDSSVLRADTVKETRHTPKFLMDDEPEEMKKDSTGGQSDDEEEIDIGDNAGKRKEKTAVNEEPMDDKRFAEMFNDSGETEEEKEKEKIEIRPAIQRKQSANPIRKDMPRFMKAGA